MPQNYLSPPLTFEFEDPRGFGRSWQKIARTEKAAWLNDQINATLGAGSTEARRLTDEEERRGGLAESTVTDAYRRADRPTITDEMLRTLQARESRQGAQDFLGGMDALRSYLGGAGVTGGGLAAGLATNLELGRLGQITDARTTMEIAKAKQDALDRADNFQRSLALGQIQARDPSTIWMNFLGDVAGIRLAQGGLEAQRSAAKDAANASKDAGWMSLAGNLGGALIGAF